MRVHFVECVAAALLAGPIALAGCARKADSQTAVRKLVDDAAAAAEDRDASAVAARLAEDFRGTGGIDRADALATLKQYFAAYESLRVAVYDVSITVRSEREADVSCRVEVTGTARRIGALAAILPPSAVYRFDLRVARSAGQDWKVQSAEWQSAEARPSP